MWLKDEECIFFNVITLTWLHDDTENKGDGVFSRIQSSKYQNLSWDSLVEKQHCTGIMDICEVNERKLLLTT